MIDFDEICETTATSLNCEYIYGDKQQVELYINANDISKSNGLIMLAPVIVQQIWNNGILDHSVYPLVLAIGRLGILSDSYQKKHRTELKDMTKLIESFIKKIGGCNTNITIKSSEISTEINNFSENLDCVFAKLTFTDE